MGKTTIKELKEATNKELDKFDEDAEVPHYLLIGYWAGSKYCWLYSGQGSPGRPPPPPPPPDSD